MLKPTMPLNYDNLIRISGYSASPGVQRPILEYELYMAGLLDRLLASHVGTHVRRCFRIEVWIVPWERSNRQAQMTPANAPQVVDDRFHYHRPGIDIESRRAANTPPLGFDRPVAWSVEGLAPGGRSRVVPTQEQLRDQVAYISYSYDRFEPLANNATARPGLLQTEVLLHEMVHVARRHHRRDHLPLLDIPEWENFDEFSAVLVQNYYHQETGRPLRASHYDQWRWMLPVSARDWLNTRDHRSGLTYEELVLKFIDQLPELARALISTPRAQFNPIEVAWTANSQDILSRHPQWRHTRTA